MQKRYLIAVFAALLSLPLAVSAADKEKSGKGGGFGALDKNNDGKLSLEEFSAGQKKGDPKARFDALDTDKDGFVTAKEFSAGQKKKGEGKKKDK